MVPMHQRPTTIAVWLLDEPTAVCARVRLCVCDQESPENPEYEAEGRSVDGSPSSNPKAAVGFKSIGAKNERSSDAYLWPASLAPLLSFLSFSPIHSSYRPSLGRLASLPLIFK